MKSSNLRPSQACSQNKGLSEYQRRASQLQTGPSLTGGREVGGWQPEPEGKGQSRPQRRHPLPNWAGSQLLTKSSWDPGWLASTRRAAARRSDPQRRHTAHLRWHSCCALRKPSSWDRGGDKTHHSLGESVLTKSLVTWASRAWEGHKTQAQPSLCLCGVPENLSLSGLDLWSACNSGPTLVPLQSNLEPEQCRPGNHTRCEWGQTQYGWDTASTPHRHQWYLLQCSSLLTAQLNKWT